MKTHYGPTPIKDYTRGNVLCGKHRRNMTLVREDVTCHICKMIMQRVWGWKKQRRLSIQTVAKTQSLARKEIP